MFRDVGETFAGRSGPHLDRGTPVLEISGTNYFVCRFAFGSLSYPQSRAALDLFADEVMLHFTRP